MSSWLTGALAEPRPESLLFLRRDEVVECLADCDPVGVVRDALLAHGAGDTTLPGEAYLAWHNGKGAYTRSIGMPGAVAGRDFGMKIINASVTNPELGMERAGGLGLCFDSETARVTTVMEVGVLSAVRTAAVSALAVDAAGYGAAERVGVVGCGTQARLHLALLLSRTDTVTDVTLFDERTAAAEALAGSLTARHPGLRVTLAPGVPEAMAGRDVVFFLTTASEGYVREEWIAPGALLVNVSLGDLTDEVLIGARALYIDDLELIVENPRRPLGRLIGEGRIAPAAAAGPSVTATIAELLAEPAKPVEEGYVVVNPFGLGVLDVALFAEVRAQAEKAGRGQRLRLL
ncbi:ornithine cyclodeaminase [Amycolatopsis sp. Hca4]|uniref:ornithine cyclodeaminase n=1 Tax=unclassified Amycolatopsis TaxID=2618356 RepID=UPI0015911F4E|nr:ornithine cyclodeaminase [Amycolatopsis sp. Hca4]QKV74653.1 ornithine cyclodeaminase [Amycolatopsis sp. Hca4]